MKSTDAHCEKFRTLKPLFSSLSELLVSWTSNSTAHRGGICLKLVFDFVCLCIYGLVCICAAYLCGRVTDRMRLLNRKGTRKNQYCTPRCASAAPLVMRRRKDAAVSDRGRAGGIQGYRTRCWPLPSFFFYHS